MIARRAAFALLAAGCGAPPSLRLAGHGADDGGIGGTGIIAAAPPPHGTDDGGIGGTGIIGVVLEAGPVLAVNGLALRAGNDPTLRAGNDATLRAGTDPKLRTGDFAVFPGDTITAIAIDDASSPATDGGPGLVAARAAVFIAAAGPLVVVTGGFAIQGTRVRVAPDTPVREPDGTLARIAPGRGYAVSGLWRDGEIVATSLRRLPEPTPLVTVRGPVRAAPGGGLRIGGTRLDSRSLSAALAPDTYAEATGVPGPAGLRVEALAAGVPPALRGRRRLAVEGFVSPNDNAPGFHLSGFGLPFDEASRITLAPGPRRVFLGRIGEAGFRIAEAVALPEDVGGRAAALGGPGMTAAIGRWRRG